MKRNKVLIYFTLFFCGQLFLTACEPVHETNNENSCIPAYTEFAYFAGEGTPYPEEPVLPPDPWTLETIIDLEESSPIFLGVRILPNNVYEFWLMAWWEDTIYTLKSDDYELRPVNLNESISKPYLYMDDVFIMSDNSVWTTHDLIFGSNSSILGKYNDITNEIVPVDKLVDINHNTTWDTQVLLNQQKDQFWFLVPYGNIYSYDPSSDTLEKHMAIGDKLPGGAEIAPGGNIYIYSYRHENSNQGAPDALFEYSPNEESIKQIPFSLNSISHPVNLFIDKSERLWVDSEGWMEPGGTWYQMLHSPLFLSTRGEINDWGGVWHWFPPSVEFEGPEDVLWFSGLGGTYSLSVSEGTWCWVSTYHQIEIDSLGNIWMVADGKLYKLASSR